MKKRDHRVIENPTTMLTNQSTSDIVFVGGFDAMTIYDRLRDARNKMGYSQKYVAQALRIGRSAVAQIEQGNRKVNTEELIGFCRLYHLSADYLLGENTAGEKQRIFDNEFEGLTDEDQQEILNLISFKKAMTDRGGI